MFIECSSQYDSPIKFTDANPCGTPSIFVEVSQIILQEADQPELVVDLSDAHHLAGEHTREVDHVGYYVFRTPHLIV